MFCHKCGAQVDDQAAFCDKCGAALTNMRPTVSAIPAAGPVPAAAAPLYPAVVQYAGFWRRLAAAIIDGLIFGAIQTVIQFILMAAGVIDLEGAGADPGSSEYARFLVAIYGLAGVMTLAQLVYCVLMESSSRQATLGKMVLGIVVTDYQGARISLGRAIGRNLAELLFEITFIIYVVSAIMIAATDRKQGLHDIMASTLVVVKK